MLLYFLVTLVLMLSGALMGLLALIYHSPLGKAIRIRDAPPAKVSDAKFRRNVSLNAMISLVLTYVLSVAVDVLVVDTHGVTLRQWLGQTVAILMLFDFSYYCVHRYPFHEWKILRKVHAVHHVIRSPSAVDSLYLHPLEGFLGQTLFFTCVVVVGKFIGSVNVYAFISAFLVYTVLNIVVHCGLDMKIFPLSIFSALARRHDEHHRHMQAKNYGSVSPLPDLLLGTRVPTGRNGR